ncbi:MAG TPA: hypothetical protein VGF51_08270, partial [Acidimicrobiales bacterium]
GTGGRLAFQVWATHGGGPSIAHFSAGHGITSTTAWTAALILMALSEVVVRTGVLAWRSGLLSEGAARALGTAARVTPGRSSTLVSSGVRSMMDSSDRPLS